MQPITQNITFVRGDTLQFDVHLTDVEATVESMFFSAKKSATDTEYAFQKSLDDGIALVEENVYRVRVAHLKGSLNNSGSCQMMAPFLVERKCKHDFQQ